MEKVAKKQIYRQFTGEVISTKMDKTIVILVEKTILDKTYKKRYALSTKYKVHDEKGVAKVGNIVQVRECRPLSKTKRFRLIKIVKAKK